MGLTADFTRLGESVTTYAKALDKAYAAAVKQLQMMDNLEKKARTSALAIAESANKMSASAAKMQATGGGSGGFDSDGNYNPNGNPYWGGKTLEQMLGWDLSPQIDKTTNKNNAAINDALSKFKDGTNDFTTTINQLNHLLLVNQKAIDQNTQTFSETERQLQDAKNRNDRNIINNLTKVKSEQDRYNQVQIDYSNKLKELIDQLNEAKPEADALAADWRDAISEFSRRVNTNDIQGESRVDDVRLEALAKKLMEAMMSGTNTKTYTIQLNGNDIRTIDDPTDLIRLIEEMSRSKRTAL